MLTRAFAAFGRPGEKFGILHSPTNPVRASGTTTCLSPISINAQNPERYKGHLYVFTRRPVLVAAGEG